MATLPHEPSLPAGADVSAAEWLAARGATPKMLAAAEACYANDFGASLAQLGLREMIAESRAWDSGAPGCLTRPHSWIRAHPAGTAVVPES